MTIPHFKSDPTKRGRSKYRAVPTVVDGVRFHSKKEADRYVHLKYLESKGLISKLVLQRPFVLLVNGVKLGKYLADFNYLDHDGRPVTEDVKGGPTTPLSRWKMKHVKAQYGIEVREVR